MKNIIRSLNEDYGEYLGNIDMEAASYDKLAKALQGIRCTDPKKIAEVYGERYQSQLDKVAQLQIELDNKRAEYNAANSRLNELKSSLDWDFLTSDSNAMGFIPPPISVMTMSG
jgi:chromosome segregation ATPase